MTNLYGYFVNNELLQGPMLLPNLWITSNNEKIVGFNRLLNTNPQKLLDLNWYLVNNDVIDVEYDNDYESITYSSWRIENNVLTRDYVIVSYSFEVSLDIAFKKLNKNRSDYEHGGFEIDYYGTSVIVLTDSDSQAKLIASEIKAKEGTRLDTDIWRFIKSDGSGSYIVELSNADLLTITSLIYNNIQNSFKTVYDIAWQMLGTGNTETLKQQIQDGTINLNPWNVGTTVLETPWQLT